MGESQVDNWVHIHNFQMIQYENSRWIEHFKVSGNFVSPLTMKLKHLMQKDIRYKCVVHVRICVVYFLYKLVHWCIFVSLQWNFRYWQVNNSFGFARLHLYYECGFQFNGQNKKTWWKCQMGSKIFLFLILFMVP